MNHAHQDTSREGEINVFGYDLANAFAPPSPPPLSNSRAMPLLTNAEVDNNLQFLDFFMNPTTGSTNIFDSFDNIQADSLPNFQGMSSAFGRPDAITYDTTMFTNPSLDTTRQFDTTSFYTARHQQHTMPSTADIQSRLFPQPEPVAQPRERPTQTDPTTLGFGSDAAFASRRYAAPPGQDESAVTEKLLALVDTFEMAPSVPNSHPTSPIMTKKRDIKDTREASITQISQLRKRRQSELEDAQSGGSSDEGADSATERKGSKVDKQNWSNYRRKSKGKVNEAKRQNLTDKEKRENHIRSEQKRRNQIKEGFASLLEMMPNSVSDGAGNSKCIILSKSVDWMTSLKDGNERLRAQLIQLGGSL